MGADGRVAPTSIARAYFALQAVAGAAWWAAVFASDDVQRWTLGRWDPGVLVVPDLLLFVGASALAASGHRVAGAVAAAWTTAVTVALAVHGLVDRVAGPGVVLMALATVGSVAAAATLWSGRLPTRWFFVGPFSFREAAETSGRRHLRRSLGQLVVFWSAFFLVVPFVLRLLEQRLRLVAPIPGGGTVVVGLGLFVAASALGLWSCVTMALQGHGTPLPAATARDLVVAGPYRWVRYPMAVAGAIQTASVGLALGSWTTMAVALAGAVAWNVAIRPEEEADLAVRFGEPYRRYARQVRCWLPTRPARPT